MQKIIKIEPLLEQKFRNPLGVSINESLEVIVIEPARASRIRAPKAGAESPVSAPEFLLLVFVPSFDKQGLIKRQESLSESESMGDRLRFVQSVSSLISDRYIRALRQKTLRIIGGISKGSPVIKREPERESSSERMSESIRASPKASLMSDDRALALPVESDSKRDALEKLWRVLCDMRAPEPSDLLARMKDIQARDVRGDHLEHEPNSGRAIGPETRARALLRVSDLEQVSGKSDLLKASLGMNRVSMGAPENPRGSNPHKAIPCYIMLEPISGPRNHGLDNVIDKILNKARVSWPLVFEHESKPFERRETLEIIERRDAFEFGSKTVFFVLFVF